MSKGNRICTGLIKRSNESPKNSFSTTFSNLVDAEIDGRDASMKNNFTVGADPCFGTAAFAQPRNTILTTTTLTSFSEVFVSFRSDYALGETDLVNQLTLASA